MKNSLIIPDLDAHTLERLEFEAKRRGQDVKSYVLHLIKQSLGLETPPQKEGSKYHDLDALAGTWTEEEANLFQQHTASFEQIEEDLWK